MPDSVEGFSQQTVRKPVVERIPVSDSPPLSEETQDDVPVVRSEDLTRPPNGDVEGEPHRSTLPTPPVGHHLPCIPGYIISSELARGGMGVVYLARDKMLNREVAVKTLLPNNSINPVAYRRFVTEARINARLAHPGIPPVHELGTLADGRPFLAMKMIRGRTLAAVLTARAARPGTGPGDSDEIEMTALHAPGLLQVFEQICLAVGYAHSQNVIHRDLKPANVMIGAFGEVQVMDWGLAREMERNRSRSIAETVMVPAGATVAGCETAIHALDETEKSRIGEALGTPAFMPPEQAAGDWDNVDARADVFALGGILCVILTGQPPYTGRTLGEVLQRAVTADLNETYRRLESCGADRELIALAKRCLAADPKHRLPNAGAIAATIHAHQYRQEERIMARAAEKSAREHKQVEERCRLAVEIVRKEGRIQMRKIVQKAKKREQKLVLRYRRRSAVVFSIFALAVILSRFIF